MRRLLLFFASVASVASFSERIRGSRAEEVVKVVEASDTYGGGRFSSFHCCALLDAAPHADCVHHIFAFRGSPLESLPV